MYANQGREIEIPNVECNEAQCVQDFELRYKKRTMYPGACSLDYQAAMQKVCELLGWYYKRNCSKGVGMYGKCIAFMRGDEEQGRGTFHGHCLVWLDGFEKSKMLYLTLIQKIARMPDRNYISLLTDIFVLITSIPGVFKCFIVSVSSVLLSMICLMKLMNKL